MENKSITKKANKTVAVSNEWISFGTFLWVLFGGVVTAGWIKIWQSALSVGWEYWVVVGLPMIVVSVMLGRY